MVSAFCHRYMLLRQRIQFSRIISTRSYSSATNQARRPTPILFSTLVAASIPISFDSTPLHHPTSTTMAPAIPNGTPVIDGQTSVPTEVGHEKKEPHYQVVIIGSGPAGKELSERRCHEIGPRLKLTSCTVFLRTHRCYLPCPCEP